MPGGMTAADLAARRCSACNASTPRVPPERVRALLADLPEWTERDAHLVRAWKLRDFPAVMKLVNRIAEIAEAEQHHPDFTVHDWNRLDVSIWTHAIGGLSENDFILAAKISAIIA